MRSITFAVVALHIAACSSAPPAPELAPRFELEAPPAVAPAPAPEAQPLPAAGSPEPLAGSPEQLTWSLEPRAQDAPPASIAAAPAGELPDFALGAEARVYPNGWIPALYGEATLSDHAVLTFDLGGNFTDRGSDGEHDDEEGDGFGGGVGYRHYFGPQLGRWFAGARVDVWWMDIDWCDDHGLPTERMGTSDVVVVMPTIEGGYGFRLGQHWRLNLFAAVGAEINVNTDGEDVGDGAIALLGLSILYEF